MSKKNFLYILFLVVVFFVWSSCSTQKNTAVTRWYHSINSRYNIHFNAQVAYDEALKAKNESYKDNMTEMLNVFPFDPASVEKKAEGGSFNKVIDKCVKAVKLHSISKKPIKDASKKNDTKYQKWYNQREFNPFLRNSWLLMAKAEFQNNDYLKSISTFSYITRLFSNDPEAVAEARIWTVMAYGELGWIYEAEDILKKIELAGGVPKGLEGEFNAANANLLIRAKRFEEAIPYLEKAADKAENQRQKIRLKYLLGQAYEKAGNRLLAYKAYSEIGGLNIPYIFEMNAKLKQAENSGPEQHKGNLAMLDGMAKNPKNKEYLDQIYYAKVKIFLNQGDTTNAIVAYTEAIAKSTRNGPEKAHIQVSLGDLYFLKHKYVKAQACYSGALGGLSKDHEDYERVALRSKVLEQLAQYDEAIILQDSLQGLVRMPEPERMNVIDKIIEDLKKKEKEEKLLADKAKAEANATVRPGMAGQIDIPVQANTQGGFYYDNEQSILQGRNAFQKKWGSRKQEDNWRRLNKTVSVFAESPNTSNRQTVASNDSLPTHRDSLTFEPSNDKHMPGYYLQQLPFKKEQIAASDSIIDDAMFQMAGIYHQQLEDTHLAIETYEKELTRFPQTPNKQEVYFRLYMLNHGLGEKTKAENYRQKMMADFPNSDYAKSFAAPNYEWNLQNPRALQDSLYEQSYNAYLKSDVNTVRKRYEDIQVKYPQSDLIPKFLFLNALTYAQTKEEDKFRNNLKEILEKYPQSDVTPVAKDMLKESLSGKSLVGGNPIKGLIWNASFGKDSTSMLAQIDSTVKFTVNDNSEHVLLLVYPLKQTNRNDLLYAIADYNFSHYVLSTFDLIFDDQASTGILQIKGFSNFAYLKQYVNDAIKNSLFNQLGKNIVPVPISIVNYNTLQSGKTLNDYFGFFNQNYANSLPLIIALWTENKKAEKEKIDAQAISESQAKPTPTTPKIENTAIGEVKVDSIQKKDINISNIKVSNSTSFENTSEEDKLAEDQKILDTANKTVKNIKEAYSNPIEGLKGLIKNIGNKPKLTKEEKEEQKKIQNIQKAEKARLAKIQRELEKAHNDSIESINKSEKIARQKAEKENQDLIKTIENQKLAAAKNKEDARKAREAELLQKERKRKEELKIKEKERKEKLKAREKELKEKERLQKEKKRQREKNAKTPANKQN